MRPLEMIVPSWRDFPARLLRLAAAALVISTAMSVPRATVAGPAPSERAPASATTAP